MHENVDIPGSRRITREHDNEEMFGRGNGRTQIRTLQFGGKYRTVNRKSMDTDDDSTTGDIVNCDDYISFFEDVDRIENPKK